MASQAIENPLPTFTGLDGLPLSDGYVYFGQPDLNPIEHPVSVYFDADLTIPAQQPIRTNAGYLWRNGAPTNVWVNGTYSTLAQDSQRRQVYYSPEWTAASSENISFIQAGVGAVIRSAQSKMREIFSVKDFGAVGDGVTDDTAAITAAITALYAAGGGTLYFPPGNYLVSSVAFNWSAAVTIDFVGAGQRASFITSNGSASPVLDLSVDIGVLDVYSCISNLSIVGSGNAQHGVQATRLASFTTENLSIRFCDTAFNSLGCLVTTHQKPNWNQNNKGYVSDRSGAIYPNLVNFNSGSIKNNNLIGIDLIYGAGIGLDSVDIEQNGAAGDVTTGGMFVRATVDDENGYSNITLVNCWFEANKGWTFNCAGAGGAHLTMIGTRLLNAEGTRAASITGISSVVLQNVEAPSPTDTVTLACGNSVVIGGTLGVLTDTSTAQTHVGVTTAAGAIKHYTNVMSLGSGGMLTDPAGVIGSGGTFAEGDICQTINDYGGLGATAVFYKVAGPFGNSAASCLRIGTNSGTGRSLNAGGTVNASGADYAEYERKALGCGTFAKGAIVGFDSDGKLTDKFLDAVSFGIKSTSPSYVGGDDWFNEQPPPEPGEKATKDERRARKQEREQFDARLEAKRQTVDRIAYAGKVPANVIGAQLGDYIVPVAAKDGGIEGAAVAAPTFEQYQLSVGRVRSLLPDGRPMVAVKVV